MRRIPARWKASEADRMSAAVKPLARERSIRSLPLSNPSATSVQPAAAISWASSGRTAPGDTIARHENGRPMSTSLRQSSRA